MTAPFFTPTRPEFVIATPLTDREMLSARHAAITEALSLNPTPDDLLQLKQDIVALFREADAALVQAQAFKESVKELVAHWKRVNGQPVDATTPSSSPVVQALPTTSASAPAPDASPVETRATERPTPRVSERIDHLGASTFVEKGWSKLSVGDAVGAEVALRRALELSPFDSEAATLLGWAQMMQEQYDAALVTFNQVLTRDPQHALARTNVGYICLRTQQYGEAIEHLSLAIRSDSDKKATLYSHLYLGMVYREREMFEDAELFFLRTLELGPNMLQAWYELGRSRWFAGRYEDAKQAWRAGAEANKFNPWGKRCAEMLRHIEEGGAPPRTD